MSLDLHCLSSWQGSLFEPLDPTLFAPVAAIYPSSLCWLGGVHVIMLKTPLGMSYLRSGCGLLLLEREEKESLSDPTRKVCWCGTELAVDSSTMANWHARDICGILLLLLVFTEAARKWAFVQDLGNAQIKQMTLTHDPAIHPARRLLEPQVKPGYQIQALCRTEQECEDGVGVTCMQGNVVACSCNFIAVCYPNVKRCSVYNSTHIESCGF